MIAGRCTCNGCAAVEVFRDQTVAVYSFETCTPACNHPTRNNESQDLLVPSRARLHTSYDSQFASMYRSIYAVTIRPKSLYEDVHASTGHPGAPHDTGQQFAVDAFTHHSVGYSGYVYAHLFTDLASRQVYPVFTKSKLVSELTSNMSELFYAHPDWKPNGSIIDRKIKVDMEVGYQPAEFREFCHTLGYRIESSPTRDKHAHGVAERSVGNIVTKANIAMLGNINHPCPQTF